MVVERVDYYSDEEYHQAKQAEIREERERQERQKAMEEEMAFEQLLGEFRKLQKANKELLETAKLVLHEYHYGRVSNDKETILRFKKLEKVINEIEK